MTPPRPEQPMPDDVAELLAERGLRGAYEARPAYQRRDYLAWIARAKHPETRAKRIRQTLDELHQGGLYMGMQHGPSQRQTPEPAPEPTPNSWQDLTRPMDESLPTYREGDYADPSLAVRPWASRSDQGFEVWHLTMGTQCGTHIDAPSHFVRGGATIDQFPLDRCTGTYLRVAPDQITPLSEAPPIKETAILLDARDSRPMTRADARALCAAAPPLVILVGEPTIQDSEATAFNRGLAEAGIFLVEDTALPVGDIPPRGEYIATPLRLIGLSGSPARLLIR